METPARKDGTAMESVTGFRPRPSSEIPFGSVLMVMAIVFLLLHASAMLLFVGSFFPSTLPSSSVGSDPDTLPTFNYSSDADPARFGRVVMVVLDAFRADMVLGTRERLISTAMPFLRGKIEDHCTWSFLARADSPTVTMPRIKALMSGGIPAFVDVVFNLQSKEFDGDSLISGLSSLGRKIVFYGDDTWLKLFPRQFLRSEGTTSFFVTDTVSVDFNVTRHLDSEMNATKGAQWDWDVLILHYLGIDHVGHVFGPFSSQMGEKLSEMDGVIERVYSALERKWDEERSLDGSLPPLMIVLSDHGMTDGGSHGGASKQERNSFLSFLSPSFSRKGDCCTSIGGDDMIQVDQIDFTPTLAVLLGLPIPSRSLGIVIDGICRDGRDEWSWLLSLRRNSQQMITLLKETAAQPGTLDLFEVASSRFSALVSNQSSDSISSVALLYGAFLSKIQGLLVVRLTAFDQVGIFLSWMLMLPLAVIAVRLVWNVIWSFHLDGSVLLLRFNLSLRRVASWSIVCVGWLLAFGSVLHISPSPMGSVFSDGNWISIFLFLVHGAAIPLLWFFIFCVSVRICACQNNVQISVSTQKALFSSFPYPFEGFSSFLMLFVFVWFLASSSYVEEEHQAWFYLAMTCSLMLLRRSVVRASGRWTTAAMCVVAWLITTWSAHHPLSLGMLIKGDSERGWVPLVACVLSICGVGASGLRSLCQFRSYMRPLTVRAFSVLLVLEIGFVLFYKLSENVFHQLLAARGVFVVVAVLLLACVVLARMGNMFILLVISLHSVLLFLALLHRTFNVPLILLLCIYSLLVVRLSRSWKEFADVWPVLFVVYIISLAVFFSFGNSGSIATIDLAGAYVGLSDYNHFAVGFLLLFSTYSSSIWMILTCGTFLASFSRKLGRSNYNDPFGISLLFLVLRHIHLGFAYSSVLFVVRGHLFIWSVFSPRYVYIILGAVVELGVGFLFFGIARFGTLKEVVAVSESERMSKNE